MLSVGPLPESSGVPVMEWVAIGALSYWVWVLNERVKKLENRDGTKEL